jgi:hypothetical protein
MAGNVKRLPMEKVPYGTRKSVEMPTARAAPLNWPRAP